MPSSASRRTTTNLSTRTTCCFRRRSKPDVGLQALACVNHNLTLNASFGSLPGAQNSSRKRRRLGDPFSFQTLGASCASRYPRLCTDSSPALHPDQTTFRRRCRQPRRQEAKTKGHDPGHVQQPGPKQPGGGCGPGCPRNPLLGRQEACSAPLAHFGRSRRSTGRHADVADFGQELPSI